MDLRPLRGELNSLPIAKPGSYLWPVPYVTASATSPTVSFRPEACQSLALGPEPAGDQAESGDSRDGGQGRHGHRLPLARLRRCSFHPSGVARSRIVSCSEPGCLIRWRRATGSGSPSHLFKRSSLGGRDDRPLPWKHFIKSALPPCPLGRPAGAGEEPLFDVALTLLERLVQPDDKGRPRRR
jgi:hypothetical protein